MSNQLAKHRAQMKQEAYSAVERFLQQHSEYSIDADQSGSEGNTNYVIFGHRFAQGGEQPVIFKYFCQDERKEREVYALRHFSETGVVPQLLVDFDKRLIVQSWIPSDRQAFSEMRGREVCYTLGQAVAKLLSVPLTAEAAQAYESTFYEGLTLEEYLREILEASWLIHERVDAYRGSPFVESLASIEANRDYILSQKRLLYHQDALNMHFINSRFSGFFDLEMCKVGTEAMQIGSLWSVFATLGAWNDFAFGYAEVSGRKLEAEDFAAGRAFAHFMVWRYISRYGRWQGEPLETASDIQEEATRYAEEIERNNRVLP